MKTLLLGIVAALMVLSTAAYAYPTLAGPTGGLDSPSALVQPDGQLDIAFDWVDVADGAWDLRAAYGLAPNWEVSAMGVTVDNGDDDWGLGLKYAFPKQYFTANWAVGVDWMDDAELFQAYLAGTRPLNDMFTGSAGILYSNYSGNAETIAFANLEAKLYERFTLGGEYFFGEDSNYGNLYLRSQIMGPWSGQIGLQSVMQEDVWNLGVRYTFGGSK